MCGITGYWLHAGGFVEPFRADLARAVESLRHRGPDDHGVWSNDAGVGLGHTRLAILDLSEQGRQPMVSADGRYTLVFNGEIYNFRELREQLEGNGARFRGSGDTEVVLAAFIRWGVECVQRFIGMFAFAVWDSQQSRMYLFRDRVGVKPLYYGWNGRVLWFGSELKALREFHHWRPEVDRQALGEFFQYGYISAPKSIYRGINKLSPGSWLELGPDGEPRVRGFWSLQDEVARQGPLEGSEDELAEQLEELLIDAFQYRMVSDVPVGVFLSGGIDSTAVAAILQAHSRQQIHTFTIGFEDSGHDESPWAKQVADYLGTRHTEFVLNVEQACAIVPELPTIYDEPFGDSSGIPTLMVSRLARQDVKVALSADGGDELFGGYDSYALTPKRYSSIHGKPSWMRRAAKGVLSRVLASGFADRSGVVIGAEAAGKLVRRMHKLTHLLPDSTPGQVFRAAQSHWLPEEVDRLVGGYTDPRGTIDDFPGLFQERMMRWDFVHYLPEDILTKVDRATMAVGLEGREPMLDHRIIEFAFRLPLQMRIGELGGKHLLRKVLYKYVPRCYLERPKQGFAIPKVHWMRRAFQSNVRELIETSLRPENLSLDAKLVRRELERNRRSGVNSNRVWMLFVFALWQQAWNN